MSSKRALQTILVIGLGGLVFSGYLSYQEFYGAAPTCSPLGQPGSIFGYPACVYGFIMYLGIVIIALLGLRDRTIRRAKGRSQLGSPPRAHGTDAALPG